MRYFLALPIAVSFEILAKILAPILPAFAVEREGPGMIKNEMAVEPRLPKWLDWFMMDDHSLWGGREWREEICPHYKSYRGMMQWLLRNSAVNFGRYALALPPDDPRVWQKRGYYQLTKTLAITTNFGWNLDKVNKLNGLAAYVWSVRFKRTK